MGRRLISLMAALAIGTMGALAFAAPSNAATPPPKVELVTFSANDCSGKTVVTLTNPKVIHVGLVFNVDGTAVTVDNDTTKDVTIPWPASVSVDVSLTGFYVTPAPTPTVLSLSKGAEHDFITPEVKTWHHDWVRPDGCWEVVTTSTCDGHFQIGVKNTGPNQSKFEVQVDGSTGIDQVVAGGSAWTASYTKGQSVTLVIDDEARAPITYVKPDCSTPTPVPTTAAPGTTPPVAAPTLPVTGASMTLSIVTFLGLLVAGVVVAFYMRFRRNRATQ